MLWHFPTSARPRSFLTAHCHLRLSLYFIQREREGKGSHFQAVWVLIRGPGCMRVCLFSRGTWESWILNTCRDILKTELNIIKRIAKISCPYLGKSAEWRVLFIADLAFQISLFFNPDSAMLVLKRNKCRCCSENLASQREILRMLSQNCQSLFKL